MGGIYSSRTCWVSIQEGSLKLENPVLFLHKTLEGGMLTRANTESQMKGKSRYMGWGLGKQLAPCCAAQTGTELDVLSIVIKYSLCTAWCPGSPEQ